MKILRFQKNQAKILIENLDDLWTTSTLVDTGDIIEGRTFRKIKLGSVDDRSQNIVKKPVFLKISAEKVEFHQYSDVLRISGKTVEPKEDIPKGSYHTFNVEVGTQITIDKADWLNYQSKKLDEASKDKNPDTLICVLDRETAYMALLKKYGFEVIAELQGDVAKKDEPGQGSGNFYADIIKSLIEYTQRHNIKHVILASPAFWKEDLMKSVKDPELKKKIVQATCSSCDKGAINEVLKRPEVQSVLQKERVSGELALVESLLSEISKDGAAAYGVKETEAAIKAGAVNKLLITDKLIQTKRQEEKFQPIEVMMKTADKMQAEVHIISSENDGGKKLDGLGGIGAILRYKLNY